jgi:hypothetical protein
MKDFLAPEDVTRVLEGRLGRLHARQRLGMERDHEAQIFGQGLTFFHIENIPGSAGAIEALLRLSGAYGRGRANAAKVEIRENKIASARIPAAFDGFSILHLSDLHADMSAEAMLRASAIIADLSYDLCVLTGDYRGQTFGPYLPCCKPCAICSTPCGETPMAFSAITTPFGWRPISNAWASGSF